MPRPSPIKGSTPAAFLLVTSRATVSKQLDRALRDASPESDVEVVIASTHRSAVRALQARRKWAAWIVAPDLPAGDALKLLARAGRTTPRTRTLVIAHDGSASGSLRRARRLGAAIVNLATSASGVRSFAVECLGARIVRDPDLRRCFEDVVVRHGLSVAEASVLLAAIEGLTKTAIATRRRVSADTIKTQVACMLRKTGAASLGALAARVLRAAMLSGRGSLPTRRRRGEHTSNVA